MSWSKDQMWEMMNCCMCAYTTWLLRMSKRIWFLWENKLHHMRERVLLHSLITRC
jgi:hypothetical protein